MRKNCASKLKKGDKVLVMGVEYTIDAVEKDDADVDLWLEPVDKNNPAFITMNMHPNTITEVIK